MIYTKYRGYIIRQMKPNRFLICAEPDENGTRFPKEIYPKRHYPSLTLDGAKRKIDNVIYKEEGNYEQNISM